MTYRLVSYTILLMRRLVVIDTNVVLSALQSKNGKSFGLISKIGSGLFDFAISVPLVLEYEAILKNHLDRNIFSDYDRGSRNKFMAVLSKVPDTEPADGALFGKDKAFFF